MTDATDPTYAENSTAETTRLRTSASLRLPKVTFEKVRDIVAGSHQMSGPASPAVIADQIGRTAKGQGWSDRWSTVRFLGFIEKTPNGKYDVTDLAQRFIGENEDAATRAAQEALMRTGFGPLIKRFGTGSPNTKAMASVLTSDYNVPDAAATKAAELLVTMATECGLIVDGRFKPAEIERAEEAAGDEAAAPPGAVETSKPRTPKPATPTGVGNSGTPKPATPKSVSTNSPATTPASDGGGASIVPFGLGPTVVLNVDATKLTATEIREIVRELQKAAGSS